MKQALCLFSWTLFSEKKTNKRGVKMILFVCSTPIQIINVINLTVSNFNLKNIDLIILDHALENKKYYEALKQIDIFNNIQFLETSHITGGVNKYRLIRYLKAGLKLLNKSKLEIKINNYGYNYDKFFISSPDLPSQLIYYYMKNKNNKIQLFMIEEGTFAYSFFNQKETILKKVYTKIIFKQNMNKNYIGAYVYKPEYMIINKKINKEIYIKKIPAIDKSNKLLLQILDEITANNNDNYKFKINEKIIFFEQVFPFEKINNDTSVLFKEITKILPIKDIIVKLHPRTKNAEFGNEIKEFKTTTPFEVLNLNNSMKNKVLISVFSTACLNPKIMFNEEPIVILLFKLLDLRSMTNFNETTYDIAYNVKESYTSKKFFIPETIGELEFILNNISNHR